MLSIKYVIKSKKLHHTLAACLSQRLRPLQQSCAQRHVATSITTLCQRLSSQLIERMGQLLLRQRNSKTAHVTEE